MTRPETEATTTEPSKTWSKKKIIKNMIVISISMCLYFSGGYTTKRIQSSIMMHHGLAAAVLSVQSFFTMISGIVLVTFIIKFVGEKSAMLLSILMLASFVASNAYPSWYLLMPTSAMSGVAYAIAYCVFFTYVSQLADRYQKFSGNTAKVVFSRFFGILFAANQSSGVLGGLAAFYALHRPQNKTQLNETLKCGAHFCDSAVEPNTSHFSTPERQLYLLVGTMTGITASSFIVILFFLDKIVDDTANKKHSLREELRQMFGQHKNIFQVLLLPLTIYSGLQMSFITVTYTKAYVTCSSSAEYVGTVMIVYSASDAFSSLLASQFVKITNRITTFLVATVVDCSLICTMFLWTPDSESHYVLYLLAAVWGLGDGVWQGQVKALYGNIFQKNRKPAFCILFAWEAVGALLGYSYSSAICTTYILYILITTLLISIACYLVVEYKLHNKQQVF